MRWSRPLRKRIADLPQGAVVGSSSVRRAAQLKRLRPDLKIVPFRGNVDTRLAKLERGDVAGDIARLRRAQPAWVWHSQATPIAIEEMLPAVAQGAIGIEIREGDERRARWSRRSMTPRPKRESSASGLSSPRSTARAARRLPGHAILEGSEIRFRGEALSEDGSFMFRVATQMARRAMRRGSGARRARKSRRWAARRSHSDATDRHQAEDDLGALDREARGARPSCIVSPLLTHPDAQGCSDSRRRLSGDRAHQRQCHDAREHSSPRPRRWHRIKVFAVGAQSVEAARRAGYHDGAGRGRRCRGLAGPSHANCKPRRRRDPLSIRSRNSGRSQRCA